MKKILLVGGAGFIGHNLAMKLIKKYQVKIVDSLSVNNLLSFSGEIGNYNNKFFRSILNERLNLLSKNNIELNITDSRNYHELSNIFRDFSPDIVIQAGTIGDGINNPGLRLNHNSMNRLHRYFEDLQGETWNISRYYKLADHETKWAIRQLNDLCHELESWVMSNRKKVQAPEWQRPSQITTFLNAPRQDLQEQDYELFLKTRYDREFGGVYLHWAQVGKTQYEVFRDEHGADIDEATCSAINSLKFYSGEFDVEWGRDINENNHDWHRREQTEFREWLQRNGFEWNDPKLSLGHIKIGQINLKKSFGDADFFEIIKQLSNHLDIYQIKTGDVTGTFDYVWSDDNYKQMQIDFLQPGYDWSKNNA